MGGRVVKRSPRQAWKLSTKDLWASKVIPGETVPPLVVKRSPLMW